MKYIHGDWGEKPLTQTVVINLKKGSWGQGGRLSPSGILRTYSMDGPKCEPARIFITSPSLPFPLLPFVFEEQCLWIIFMSVLGGREGGSCETPSCRTSSEAFLMRRDFTRISRAAWEVFNKLLAAEKQTVSYVFFARLAYADMLQKDFSIVKSLYLQTGVVALFHSW